MEDKIYNTRNRETIVLRQKKLKDGTLSLFLDIHHNGKRRREFLGMYLLPGNSSKIKNQNKQTLELAEKIRANKQIEIQTSRFDVLHEYKPQTLFLDYYRKICIKRFGTDNQSKWGNWRVTLHHLEKYASETTTFEDIDSEWIEGFKAYLYSHQKSDNDGQFSDRGDKLLSQSTLNGYYNKFKACINEAFDDRIIVVNPLRGVKPIPAGETKREHLSWDEVVALNNTPCKYYDLKRAFLFSCFTGLRKGDIEDLVWSEVRQMDGMTRIVFRQNKTRAQEYLDISDKAAYYLGERGEPDEKVFPHFKWDMNMSLEFRRWMVLAGIDRYITFHCGRHTFAVLMLSFGVDIYTVSKLLGHKELQTTQIYSRVLDKKKQEAAGLFPKMSGGASASKNKESEDNNKPKKVNDYE